jgi:hypothetical protein
MRSLRREVGSFSEFRSGGRQPRLYTGFEVTSGWPVIRPERMLCKLDYNLDRVSGLHPSVHKPDMSVWTGSVFE